MKAFSSLETELLDNNITLSKHQLGQLAAFIEFLLHWNRRVNLIGKATESEVVSRHIVDSLLALPYLDDPAVNSAYSATWLDVGSGAGLPGIPLAIARPDNKLTLLDSNSKKTRFLVQLVAHLKLSNVVVVQERVERFQPEQRYDRIISRAWTSMAEGLQLAGHLCSESGRVLFMKGQNKPEELQEIPKPFTLARCIPLSHSQQSRHLFEFQHAR